jgi:hypothetical protein
VTDEQGTLVTTSDALPLPTIRQAVSLPDGERVAGIVTDTPYYHAHWFSSRNGRWELQLKPQPLSKAKTFLVIRSVGPAGGPLRSLDWDGHTLSVDNWGTVTVDPPPSRSILVKKDNRDGQKNIQDRHTGTVIWGGDTRVSN